MKVFVAVLALVAAASAGVVVDHPVEKTIVQPAMAAGERAGVPVQGSAQAAEDALKKVGTTARLISFYSTQNLPDSLRSFEMGGMEKVLNGPVMVAFKDATEDKMHAYLLPKGFKNIQEYNMDEVHPLVEFLNNGPKKTFIDLSAGSYLQLPEMSRNLNNIHAPSFNLNTAFRIAQTQRNAPYYVLIVNDEAIKMNVRDNLKEQGVFRMENDGLKVISNNFPIDSDFEEDITIVAHAKPRYIELVVPIQAEKSLNSEFVHPTYYGKHLITKHINPLYTEKDDIRKFLSPVTAEKDPIREYLSPVIVDKDQIRDYLPIYGEKAQIHKYINPVFSESDQIRGYNPAYAGNGHFHKYLSPAEKYQIREYLNPSLIEKEPAHKFLNPIYAEKDQIRGYANPIFAETEVPRKIFNPVYAEKDQIRDFVQF